jgi:hypothetical protein
MRIPNLKLTEHDYTLEMFLKNQRELLQNIHRFGGVRHAIDESATSSDNMVEWETLLNFKDYVEEIDYVLGLIDHDTAND